VYRMLIVDDERYVFDEIAQLFDWSEFNIELIEPARNAQEALQTLMTTPVDIIIIDINMPGMNGIDLLREIRGRSMRQHVIVLSGYDDFEYVRTASLLGIDNYFLKPIYKNEMSETILLILDRIKEEKRANHDDENRKRILSENFISLWLNNGIIPSQLHYKAEVAQINIMSDTYMAAIVLPETDESLDETVLINLNSVLAESGIGYAILVNGNKIGLALKCSKNIAQKTLLDNKQLVRGLVVFGRSYQKASDMAISYSEAISLCRYGFLRAAGMRILDTETLERKRRRFVSPDNEQNIRRWIGLGDLAEYLRFVAECRKTNGDVIDLRISLLICAVDALRDFAPGIDKKKEMHQAALCAKRDSWKEYVVSLRAVTDISMSNRQEQKVSYVDQMKQYSAKHYFEGLSLKQLAQHFNISSAYLGQIFISETGMTYSKWLATYRVDLAKQLLNYSDMLISEIGKAIGFVSTSHFISTFKSVTGSSPSGYRALYREVI
jgi:two-component system response regulator YesN